MNEVTQIHLDRQSFTISVEAHKALRAYLADIEKQVGSKGADVTREVELRMAELLTERGISSEKVVLPDDITYLKEQLGEPKDFKEDDDKHAATDEADGRSPRRLYRDTQNGMLAGVAAGLANYFGIDVLLVRILFVIAVLSGGWGILIYIVLWLLVPEAKTSSERLQMRGIAVTVDNLKEAVENADIAGAARRGGGAAVTFINSFFRIILKIGGILTMFVGLCMLFGLIAVGAYIWLHGGQLFQENLFPVGRTETLLQAIGLVLAGLIAVFVILIGTAIFRRKWPIKVWATGVLMGIFFIGFAVSSALTADIVPKVRDRFEATTHSTTRALQPFSSVDITGGGINVEYAYSKDYAVKLHYYDGPNLATLKTTVVNNRLEIDSQQFANTRKCTMLCIFPNYDMIVTVYSPTLPDAPSKPFFRDAPAEQPAYPLPR
jgi:phage shock protein PspC (stress-responsive transcriptional regulator)